MRAGWLECVMGGALLGGCILEDNPDFVEAGTSGDATSMGTMGTGPTSVDTTMGPTATMSPDDSADSSTTDDPPLPEGPGCNDPALCTALHIGPIEGSCERESDGGGMTDECDEVGSYALRLALARLELLGTPGRIIMHDNNGVPAAYAGSVPVQQYTTITVPAGQDPESVVVYSEETVGDLQGVLSLQGDRIHLAGFTLACRSGGQWGLRTRTDEKVEGTETGGHLIERMIIAATKPEDVGSNSIGEVFQSLGPDTVMRNNHIWGYFEGTLDMRFAAGSIFSHNTLMYYQSVSSPIIDATQVDGLEISNNVVASLTRPVEVFVAGNELTSSLVLVGNAVERVTDLLGGLETVDPAVTYDGNTAGMLELESPRSPRVLADSTLAASALGVNEGVSLDGVALEGADVVPGAYQQRSPLSGPRRSVITVGEANCGGQPCMIDQGFENELQRAVWSAWPGTAVEIYPSGSTYAGPAVVTWPIDVRGMGTQPGQVTIRRVIEDDALNFLGVWSGKNAVLDLTRNMDRSTVIENLSLEAGPGEMAIGHEGSEGSGRHEIRRVILGDRGNVKRDPADMAIWIGDDVIVHDVLIHGAYDTCVRFGHRSWSGAETPPTTSWVHNVTCRLTVPIPDSAHQSGFEVAAVVDAVIANVALELTEPGPLFRAQRRSGEDSMTPALDPPTSFTAYSISALGHDALFDGFSDLDGAYTLVDVDPPGVAVPMFVSDADSHLIGGAAGIDGGVDPNIIEGGLMLGVSVDGIDRTGLIPDRGAYEQGM